jgi:hypothetical protein
MSAATVWLARVILVGDTADGVATHSGNESRGSKLSEELH